MILKEQQLVFYRQKYVYIHTTQRNTQTNICTNGKRFSYQCNQISTNIHLFCSIYCLSSKLCHSLCCSVQLRFQMLYGNSLTSHLCLVRQIRLEIACCQRSSPSFSSNKRETRETTRDSRAWASSPPSTLHPPPSTLHPYSVDGFLFFLILYQCNLSEWLVLC